MCTCPFIGSDIRYRHTRCVRLYGGGGARILFTGSTGNTKTKPLQLNGELTRSALPTTKYISSFSFFIQRFKRKKGKNYWYASPHAFLFGSIFLRVFLLAEGAICIWSSNSWGFVLCLDLWQTNETRSSFSLRYTTANRRVPSVYREITGPKFSFPSRLFRHTKQHRDLILLTSLHLFSVLDFSLSKLPDWTAAMIFSRFGSTPYYLLDITKHSDVREVQKAFQIKTNCVTGANIIL